MAELVLHRREWRFYVELDEAGEVPDIKREHTEITFRPTGLYFDLVSHDGAVPRLSVATIAGPRVNKAGLGAVVSDRYFGAGDLPEWALAYFSKAVEGIVNGQH